MTETEQTFESTASIAPNGNGSTPRTATRDGAGAATIDGATAAGATPNGALDGAALGRTVPMLGGARTASTADLVKLASEQVTQLVRDEVALARLEMTAKAKKMGVGAGLFGGAGVVMVYGVGAVIAGLALLLALVLPDWAAALIVGGGLFLIAGMLALIGRSEIKRAGAPRPDETIGSVKADVQTLSQAVKDGRA